MANSVNIQFSTYHIVKVRQKFLQNFALIIKLTTTKSCTGNIIYYKTIRSIRLPWLINFNLLKPR